MSDDAAACTPMTIDFTDVLDQRAHSSGVVQDGLTDPRPVGPDGKLLTRKQIRTRARRRAARGPRNRQALLTPAEFEALYKPVDEWDMEELARGRPRDTKGGFRGKPPDWINRDIHERSMERFKLMVRKEMNVMGVSALGTLAWLMQNDAVDKRGRPLVPAGVQLQASQFLIDHVIGKPTQRVETDISVKLQSILGVVMANPNDALGPGAGGEAPTHTPAHLPGHTIPMQEISDILDADIVDDG